MQVRVDAVAALRSLVDAFHEDDLPSIKPLIPSLLNQLFALMAEVHLPFCIMHHAMHACAVWLPCMLSLSFGASANHHLHGELLESMQKHVVNAVVECVRKEL